MHTLDIVFSTNTHTHTYIHSTGQYTTICAMNAYSEGGRKRAHLIVTSDMNLIH